MQDAEQSMDDRPIDTHSDLARLFAASTSVAHEVLHLLQLLQVEATLNRGEQRAFLQTWRNLWASQTRLVECHYVAVRGVDLQPLLQRLWRRPVSLGTFRARSYTRALMRAANDLLARLQRKSDPQSWQQGLGCREPQTRDVTALLAGWSPLRSEVRRRFRRFPRSPEPIIRRLVFEIGIVEVLIPEQRDQNIPADGDQDDSRPSDSLSDRASERVSISTGRSARLTRNEELIIRTLQKKGPSHDDHANSAGNASC